MPIHEYRCVECGHQDEFLRKVSEPTLTQCPACGKPSFQKLLSAAGFHLKGSGWYATDFKSKASKPAAENQPDANAAKKHDANAAKKPDAKTETKTEAKSDPKPASTTATTD